MKISSSMIKVLNDQIGMEAFASNYYLAMGSWCEITGYEGAANFFYQHVDEERLHLMKIVHYLNGVGIPAVIPLVKAPPKTFKSLESVCKTALKNSRCGKWLFCTSNSMEITIQFSRNRLLKHKLRSIKTIIPNNQKNTW